MSTRRGALTAIAWALFAAMAIAFVVVARASNDPPRRGVEYMPDMSYSVPYNIFAPNAATRDGKTLQPPVPGTVPRGVQPFRYGSTPDEALRAGRELRSPVAPSGAALTE